MSLSLSNGEKWHIILFIEIQVGNPIPKQRRPTFLSSYHSISNIFKKLKYSLNIEILAIFWYTPMAPFMPGNLTYEQCFLLVNWDPSMTLFWKIKVKQKWLHFVRPYVCLHLVWGFFCKWQVNILLKYTIIQIWMIIKINLSDKKFKKTYSLYSTFLLLVPNPTVIESFQKVLHEWKIFWQYNSWVLKT